MGRNSAGLSQVEYSSTTHKSPSEGPSAMADEGGEASDMQHGVIAYTVFDRDRDGERHETQAHALQEPLKHNCVLLWRLADQVDGEWSDNPWSTTRLGGLQKAKLCGSIKLASSTRGSLAGLAGWLEWLVE